MKLYASQVYVNVYMGWKPYTNHFIAVLSKQKTSLIRYYAIVSEKKPKFNDLDENISKILEEPASDHYIRGTKTAEHNG